MTAPSRSRRPLRILLGAVWLLALCELGAWAAVSVLEGGVASYSVLRARQTILADQELRARGPETKERPPGREGRSLDIRHPYLGFLTANVPENSGQGVTYLMSPQLGDRDAACFQEDTYVVGIAGGSVAANLTRTYGLELKQSLEASPLLEGKTVEIVCLATAGHKQPQALISYLFLLSLGVQFDAMLVLDGFNEIALHVGAATRYHMLPAYPRQWVTRTGLGKADRSLLARHDLAKAKQAEAAEDRLTSSLWFSWIGQLRWYLADRKLDSRVRALASSLESSGEMGVERTGPQRRYQNRKHEFQDLVGIWERSARAMAAHCAEAGTLYLHFLQPNQYVPGSKPMGDQERKIAYDPKSKYRNRVEVCYPMLQARGQALEADGILFHDLTPLFQDIEERLYVDDCCHVKHSGSVLMGEAMAQALFAAVH